jgi:hypothetical protein
MESPVARSVGWIAAALAWVAWSAAIGGQTTVELSRVHSIYVGSFGQKQGADTLRQDLVDVLKHTSRLTVVTSPSQADARVEGTGEVWVKGYYTLNPRQRMVSSEVKRVYAGYLSIELKDQRNETLWSYLATPPSQGSEDVPRTMAAQAVKKLLAALEAPPPQAAQPGAR